MKVVKLIHNPTAGDEEHEKEALVEKIESQGYQCRYSSTKKDGWKDIKNDIDLIVIAGGDGTVRKVIKEILNRHVLDKDIPLALLPLGTANNFAKTLGLPHNPKKLINAFDESKRKGIDVGRIYDLPDTNFFIESFGFGIFPYLMQVMKKNEEEYDSPEEELKGALKKLHGIINEYEPRNCKLVIDGSDHSGNYILAEVMNTKSIGPNLVLNPNSDPGDGELEIVLIPETQKQKFADYIKCLINDEKASYQFSTIQAKKITISWDGTHAHVDDEVMKLKEKEEINVEIKPNALHFLIPPEADTDNNGNA